MLEQPVFRISEAIHLFRDAGLRTFAGKHNEYQCIGLLRALAVCYGADVPSDEAEWHCLRDMSPGMTRRLKGFCIYEFEEDDVFHDDDNDADDVDDF